MCATDKLFSCSYAVHAPTTDAGRMAWGVFKDMCWRVRSAGLGVVGVELAPAISRLARAGLDPEDAEDLLMACERGFVAAINEKDDEQ